MGITNDPAKAKEIVGKMTINGLTTGSGENQRMVKATDFAYKGWMQDRVDSFGNYAVQMRPEDVANLLSSAREVLGADFKPPTNVSKSQLGAMGITITGGVGVAASIALRGAPLVLPKLGAVAAPVVIAGAAGAPFAIVTSQYLKEVYDNGLARERDKIMPLPVPPNLTMEDHGDAPPLTARPTDTAEQKPVAPTIPGPDTQTGQEITVRLQTKPQAQPEAQPETNELPQPHTPDAPRNNEPPQNAPKPPINPNTVPPIIIGAGALGKLALDKISAAQKAELTKAGHILPSLPPDPNRLPEGNPKVPSKKDKDPTNLRSINRENESAKTLAELGYKIEQLSDAAAGKYQGIKKPDFKIEGNIFDNYAPSASKSARGVWSEIRDKISDHKTGVKQADRFVINMDDSKLSLEEMTKQFKDFPLEDLKEIILVKNGEAVLFFPFE